MSTPSTATAVNPPHYLHYGYPLHPTYHPAGAAYETTGSFLTNSSLLTNSHYGFSGNNDRPSSTNTPRGAASSSSASRQPQHHAAPMPLHSSTSRLDATRQQRTPNWREFYKNGIPKEVIVIDDDEDDEEDPFGSAVATTRGPQSVVNAHPGRTSRTMANGASIRHVNKKRKTAVSGTGRDPGHPPQTAHDSASGSATTVSTDRTTSALHTTAPTSLGSHYSQNGLSDEPYVVGKEVAGQKRKRTRKQVADEAKRQEMERQGDAFSLYHPPPKPPIKAKDVSVPVVHDVRSHG